MRRDGTRRRIVALLTFAVLVGLVAVPVASQVTKKRPTPPISFNEAIPVVLAVGESSPAYQQFNLLVPEEVFALEIQIQNAPADVDILLFNAADDLVAYSELPRYNETLQISRITDPVLVPGRYDLEIAYQYGRPPTSDGRLLETIECEVVVRAITPAVVDTLKPGESIVGTLSPDEGMVAIYRIEVPVATDTLRVDLSDSVADLDLFLTPDAPAIDPFDALYWSQSVRSTEVIIVNNGAESAAGRVAHDGTTSTPPSTAGGTYYATVIDQISDTYPAEFRLSVHDDVSAPEHLFHDMIPPRVRRDADRPLYATVELLTYNGGGSGVIVHPDGYILTNRHVILADTGEAADEITVGVSEDFGKPPRERYRAEVIEENVERDLALLRIVSGRYGEPLPSGLEFPYLEPSYDTQPQIGDDLRFVGYPSIGGTGSRASITYTRGTVAGFQDVPFGRLIKTDAEINDGSSGGAAVDASLRLVGLPTEVVGLDAGQLAFIYPTTAIPSRWRRILSR